MRNLYGTGGLVVWSRALDSSEGIGKLVFLVIGLKPISGQWLLQESKIKIDIKWTVINERKRTAEIQNLKSHVQA
jgi:hypothetical protein